LLLYNKKMTSNNSSQYNVNINDNYFINNLRPENLVNRIISNPPYFVIRRNLRDRNSPKKNEINFIDIFSQDNYEANFR